MTSATVVRGGVGASGREPIWDRREAWVVALIVAHSVAVGVMLTFFPAWATRFAGWESLDGFFFTRQGGIFHFVVAFAYTYEWLRLRGVTILVVTKSTACLFLVAATVLGEAAWSVPFSAVGDGLMGLVALAIHILASRDEE